jgi:hypothetical protein
VRGNDGRFTKKTNFSKDTCGVTSDMHMGDAMTVEPEKLQIIEGDIQASAAKILCECRNAMKCKAGLTENWLDKKA